MRRALEGLEGVDRVEVDLASGEAVVSVGGEVTNEELVKAVEGKVILSWARVLLAYPRWGDR
ncbi:MAG: heavy-metal-associated domain-containing protein [Chloroflexi bacterium]|nr:heavy-metal-associated domain-containing protein [Chloroflexota bacterium]